MGDYWFEQKEWGYGAVPTTGKGAALLIGYVLVLLIGLVTLIATFRAPFWAIAYTFGLTVPFLWICWRKTRGGWGWRSGSDPAP